MPQTSLIGRADATAVLYRARCLAAATGPHAMVLSHESAAAVHGFALLYPDRAHVHMTNGRPGGGYTQERRIVHTGVLADDDITEVDGVLVTSMRRTAVDLALAAKHFAQALTAFDVGLAKSPPAGDDECRDEMARALASSRRGVALARRALSFADGRAESPGESWSRAHIIYAGLPIPDLQVRYRLRSGRTAFCDFGTMGRFVGEFDGLVKYRRDMRNGEEPEDVVIREKIREDELRDLGLDVARWTWDDLRTGRVVSIVRKHDEDAGII
ncbi:hypothetical protein L5G28_11205 [Gordonia sp. HY285]|uniref:hypothetical protein n=1 Tax=Gordonia liuliyuniae TaxID=2911517 RepID=UPI001F16104B|nr:hypothetical protein [Gordonia liuliyuniae]MCF8610720.1 hypothetical protein [Gordonia liuliyuniae]